MYFIFALILEEIILYFLLTVLWCAITHVHILWILLSKRSHWEVDDINKKNIYIYNIYIIITNALGIFFNVISWSTCTPSETFSEFAIIFVFLHIESPQQSTVEWTQFCRTNSDAANIQLTRPLVVSASSRCLACVHADPKAIFNNEWIINQLLDWQRSLYTLLFARLRLCLPLLFPPFREPRNAALWRNHEPSKQRRRACSCSAWRAVLYENGSCQPQCCCWHDWSQSLTPPPPPPPHPRAPSCGSNLQQAANASRLHSCRPKLAACLQKRASWFAS